MLVTSILRVDVANSPLWTLADLTILWGPFSAKQIVVNQATVAGIPHFLQTILSRPVLGYFLREGLVTV